MSLSGNLPRDGSSNGESASEEFVVLPEESDSLKENIEALKKLMNLFRNNNEQLNIATQILNDSLSLNLQYLSDSLYESVDQGLPESSNLNVEQIYDHLDEEGKKKYVRDLLVNSSKYLKENQELKEIISNLKEKSVTEEGYDQIRRMAEMISAHDEDFNVEDFNNKSCSEKLKYLTKFIGKFIKNIEKNQKEQLQPAMKPVEVESLGDSSTSKDPSIKPVGRSVIDSTVTNVQESQKDNNFPVKADDLQANVSKLIDERLQASFSQQMDMLKSYVGTMISQVESAHRSPSAQPGTVDRATSLSASAELATPTVAAHLSSGVGGGDHASSSAGSTFMQQSSASLSAASYAEPDSALVGNVTGNNLQSSANSFMNKSLQQSVNTNNMPPQVKGMSSSQCERVSTDSADSSSFVFFRTTDQVGDRDPPPPSYDNHMRQQDNVPAVGFDQMVVSTPNPAQQNGPGEKVATSLSPSAPTPPTSAQADRPLFTYKDEAPVCPICNGQMANRIALERHLDFCGK